MARAYTKEDVINAALWRFNKQPKEVVAKLKELFEKFYDEKGKTLFRTYASVSPIAMKEYFKEKK